jgi:hypothetical protein
MWKLAQFPEKEYINGIAVAVFDGQRKREHIYHSDNSLLSRKCLLFVQLKLPNFRLLPKTKEISMNFRAGAEPEQERTNNMARATLCSEPQA